MPETDLNEEGFTVIDADIRHERKKEKQTEYILVP